MLKITGETEENGNGRLRLEGHLVGAWVAEASRCCEERLAGGRSLTLDVAEVSFADGRGVELLKELLDRGVTVANRSPFLDELIRGTAQ